MRTSRRIAGRVWGGSALLWLFAGGVITLVADLSYAEVREPFDAVWWRRQMLFWLLFTPLTPALFALARTVALERGSMVRDLARVTGFGIVFAVTHEVLIGSVRTVFGMTDLAGEDAGWFDMVWSVVQAIWLLDGIVYGVTFVAFFAAAKSRRLEERELEAATLQRRLAEARLTSLKRQLQPHFLFNTLHAIGVLARQDPDQAGRMVALLGDLLRTTLESGDAQETTLRSELEFLDRFLEIQKIRFRGRLRVTIDVAEECLDCAVPSLILQPLVENAVRHGIEKRAGEGSIRVSAGVDEGWLTLRVTDDGSGIGEGQLREGVGLGNTRERMRILYGTNQALRLLPGENGGVEAVVRIPRRECG